MMTYDGKNDPILQDSSQEPSTSSKYDFEDVGFFTHFWSCLIAEIRHTCKDLHIMMIYVVKDDRILQ